MIDRKDVLLKAAYDLLKQCHESHYVLDVLGVTAFYDEAECDGYCLMEDIKHELEIEDED